MKKDVEGSVEQRKLYQLGNIADSLDEINDRLEKLTKIVPDDIDGDLIIEPQEESLLSRLEDYIFIGLMVVIVITLIVRL